MAAILECSFAQVRAEVCVNACALSCICLHKPLISAWEHACMRVRVCARARIILLTHSPSINNVLSTSVSKLHSLYPPRQPTYTSACACSMRSAHSAHSALKWCVAVVLRELGQGIERAGCQLQSIYWYHMASRTLSADTHTHTHTHTHTQLLDAHRIEDISRLYVLSARVSALEALRSAWRDYIKNTGTKVVKDEEKVWQIQTIDGFYSYIAVCTGSAAQCVA